MEEIFGRKEEFDELTTKSVAESGGNLGKGIGIFEFFEMRLQKILAVESCGLEQKVDFV